ncbi:hypothetical protein [Paenibacillus sp. DMB5]|uniref:hypothetical protein n=1 Tax=Paenibacillus sp. DMB5 TaxID=1780103 RepID=UPI00076D92B6|nr:hypothetical protein [Paenibacillus sp. DMB5]KUP24598.1 hypothetical protein AWJ19_19935 [Paenibacillus sp. DMB5]
MKKIGIILSAVIITILAGVIMTHTDEDNSIYEPDYFTKLGLSYKKYHYEYKYETMIKELGEPAKTDEHDHYVKYIYPGLIFRYEINNSLVQDRDGNYDYSVSPAATYVKITSDTYRFGKHNIGVGSTREEVEKAYRKSIFKIVEEDSSGFRDGDSNDEQWVEYYFDKNNRVLAVELGLTR